MCGFLDVLSIDLSDNKKHNALYWKINDKLSALILCKEILIYFDLFFSVYR